MSREAYGGGGQYGGGGSPSGNNNTGGGGGREQYASQTQYSTPRSTSNRERGAQESIRQAQVKAEQKKQAQREAQAREELNRQRLLREYEDAKKEAAYTMVGGQKIAIGDPRAEELQDLVEKKSFLDKAVDLYQQYSPFGLLSNIFTGDARTAFGNNDERGGGGERDLINLLTPYAPYAMSGTTPQESMVNQYFANLGMSNQPLSSNLQTDYNNAKINMNSLLGILPPSQQFGYSTAPYGLLSSTNLASNPFNIDYLQQRGLI